MEMESTILTPDSTAASDSSLSNNTESVDTATQTGAEINAFEANIAKKEATQSVEAAPVAPKYEPKLKYSYTDPTGQKKEEAFDEMFKAIIDSEEKEKKVKELYEKAAGIDFIKADRTKLSQEYQQLRTHAEPLFQIAQEIEYHKSKGDLGSVAELLGYRKEDIINWAVEQVKLDELPENQKRVYDQHREADRRAYELERQLHSQQEQFQTFKVQQRTSELDGALSRPDVADFISQFDQRNGPNAFKDEIIKRGQMYWHTQGVDKSASELVNEMMGRFGIQPQAHSAQPQAQTMQSVSQAPRAPKDVPVIPNTGSSTAAPVKKKVTSIKDVQAEYDSL